MLVRGIGAEALPDLRPLRDGGDLLEPAGRRLAVGPPPGRHRKDADQQAPFSAARRRLAERYDRSPPANQHKLKAAETLGQAGPEQAGRSLIELAIAFARTHPAVTAAITGPRPMEQLDSQLPTADVVLDQALLDRIDQLVPPGTNLNPADGGWANPALQPAAPRR